MTLSDLLKQYDLTEDDLSTSLERRLGAIGPADATDLTDGEATFWARHAGLPLAAVRTTPGDQATAAAAAVLAEAAASLTISQAADRLGVHRSRVSHRLRDGALYSFRIGSQRRLPGWQFGTGGEPLPGLDRVLAVLPADLHPRVVEGFFTTPDADLGGTSPARWLDDGGDPAVVVERARDLDLW